MAKRSESHISSVIKTDGIANSDAISYTTVEQSVKIVNKFPATISLKGLITGKLYVWNGAGTVIEVDSRDVDDLLTKKIGETACCGQTQRGNILFEKV